MRIFNPENLVKDYGELGFSEEDQQKWSSMVGHPHGIILVTGPTGSGKTTTLYSTLKQLAVPEVNVCTVEDPIEMVEPTFNQMQVQHAIGVDFPSGIRTLMRQDPDIIMVGEIRDLETAEMAIQAALTGHLVLSTLHTNDAPSAITRLTDMGVENYLITSSLVAVLAQRLVRMICKQCRIPAGARIAPDGRTVDAWKGAGCEACSGTGYTGRVGIFELMELSEDIRHLIMANADAAQITAAARRNGMRALREDGWEKVRSGISTADEVMRVTQEF
jgi:general secretion pathway protein E